MTGILRYSFLGPEGTFTEAALTQMPGAERAERVPASSVLAALSMVDEGTPRGLSSRSRTLWRAG